MYIFIRNLGKNEIFFILWILSDAFELDANIVNFVYYGKTRTQNGKQWWHLFSNIIYMHVNSALVVKYTNIIFHV